jgi:hypothetical protein
MRTTSRCSGDPLPFACAHPQGTDIMFDGQFGGDPPFWTLALSRAFPSGEHRSGSSTTLVSPPCRLQGCEWIVLARGPGKEVDRRHGVGPGLGNSPPSKASRQTSSGKEGFLHAAARLHGLVFVVGELAEALGVRGGVRSFLERVGAASRGVSWPWLTSTTGGRGISCRIRSASRRSCSAFASAFLPCASTVQALRRSRSTDWTKDPEQT